MDTTCVYAEIVKHERTPDGDLLVTGRATGPDLDHDRQICDEKWLKGAMPDWFTWANVREQHGSTAAGVGQEIAALPDGGWQLKSLITDPVSAHKVETRTLKGYSIGIHQAQVIKDAAAPGGRIVGGQIVEISLVDRPANPSCSITLAKAFRPGPAISKAAAVDVGHGLVKVEELHDHAGDQLAELQKSIRGFDLFAVRKGDTAGQVTDLRQAVALIGGVIAADAAALADGSPTAAVDIDTLTGAAKALGWIIQQEEAPAVAHTDQDAPTTGPDATKAADELAKGKKPAFLDDDETESDEDEDDADEGKPKKKATDKAATPETPDLTELVKAAVAEAIAPLQERLAKAEAAPQAGGPVLTRTVQDIQKASNREAVLAEAERLQATADALTGSSRASYLAKAAELRRQATTS